MSSKNTLTNTSRYVTPKNVQTQVPRMFLIEATGLFASNEGLYSSLALSAGTLDKRRILPEWTPDPDPMPPLLHRLSSETESVFLICPIFDNTIPLN